MVDQFDGDLGLFDSHTHGELSVENGQPRMDIGLETSVFISLYSGDQKQYWANNLTVDEDDKIGGEYERLSENLDATRENAERLIQAILNDLNWMKNSGLAINIDVTAEIIGAKEIAFNITIFRPNDSVETFKFSNNWTGQFERPAHIGLE